MFRGVGLPSVFLPANHINETYLSIHCKYPGISYVTLNVSLNIGDCERIY
jgi:hypothetical protein